MLSLTRTVLVLIVLAAAPQIAMADRKSLEVTPLSIACSHYVLDSAFFESDVFPEPQMEHGIGCQLRFFAVLDDMPAMSLASESVRVNHFESPICNVNEGSPIGVTLTGNGIYTVDLPCEPEDMSLIFSDMSHGKKTHTVMTWVRPHDRYARAAMVAQTEEISEELTQIRLLAETILGETLTIASTTAATNASVLEIQDSVLVIQGTVISIQTIAVSINSTVGSILDKVRDILGALP